MDTMAGGNEMKGKFYPDSSQPSTDCQDIKQEKTNKNNPPADKNGNPPRNHREEIGSDQVACASSRTHLLSFQKCGLLQERKRL